MNSFVCGMKKGWPIAVGYLAVSFAFGVMTTKGMTPLMAIILSLTNLTSSGQFAGTEMMFQCASFIEIGLTVFLINLRYILMSVSLSQKLDDTVPTWQRLLFGYGITDEIFAVAITEERKITASYMFGLILLPVLGWTLGTGLGAFGATFFPERILESLGIALYAMFISILVPDMKKSKPVFFVVALAILISCVFYYVPVIKEIGTGFKIIIATVISAGLAAVLFPVPLKEEE